MDRNAPGSGDELDIPMDGRTIDRPPHGVAPATAAIIVVLVLCSTLSALGHSPFRLEGAYVYPNRVAVSGMADITRWLSVRLSLLDVHWSVDSALRYVRAKGGSGFTTFEEAGLVLSPWRDRLKVQPYAFGGLGISFADSNDMRHGIQISKLALQGSYGIGVEPLLFFLHRAPALFLELGQTFGGRQTTIHGLPQLPLPPWYWVPELKAVTRIAVGVRI